MMTTELTQYLFTPKSHYPIKILILPDHGGANGMKGTSMFSSEAWYDPMTYGHQTNKISGITFDKKITLKSCGIWNHRNSMRLGWIPSTKKYYFKLYLYMHVNGCPYIPTPYSEVLLGTVSAEYPFDWELIALEKETTGWYKQYDKVHLVTSLRTFTPAPGYTLGPYHGGSYKPIKQYRLFTNAELIYPH